MTISETRYLKRQQPFTTSYPLAAVSCNVVAQLSIQYLHSCMLSQGVSLELHIHGIPGNVELPVSYDLVLSGASILDNTGWKLCPFLAASTPIRDNPTTSVPFSHELFQAFLSS